ncbi:ceramidase domain-containing protein [Phaeobacter marinintestinus]|uniref:ceramidase domain-containing protein n=1 Tax=Falsiphaeobacter marinintestinus TaxID=1492905 RepID=UPI0011B68653|nr:ceramidase domain-containing protein [Phaeobacter marinintestinus]
MDWFAEIDAYCERLGPGYWAEPLNAVTNLAFILSALLMWRRADGVPMGRVLAVILFAIGVGSALWHTYAQGWAGAADTVPILMFILVYIFTINRDVWGLTLWPAVGLTALFIPYTAALVPVFSRVPGLGDSAGYAPVPLLILIYAGLLRNRAARTARGLAIGAILLILSIMFRALDDPICGVWPTGTHFLWHILNAIMLGWMIEVFCRHQRDAAA